MRVAVKDLNTEKAQNLKSTLIMIPKSKPQTQKFTTTIKAKAAQAGRLFDYLENNIEPSKNISKNIPTAHPGGVS